MADRLSCAGAAEYKRMLKHLREPKASLSVIPEGIKGEHSAHSYFQQYAYAYYYLLSCDKGRQTSAGPGSESED